MRKLNKIKLVAVDVDGVLLTDTYSSAIKSFVEQHGGKYTSELERLVWGSPHIAGGHNLALACKLPWTAQKTIEEFFRHHSRLIQNNPIRLISGSEKFLEILKEINVKVTSYGGRTKEYIFDQHMGKISHYFDKEEPYIDTNLIRPGVKEIVTDFFNMDFDEVLFVDDINRMAEVARYYGVAFIGTPVTNYQKEQMRETGVKYIVNSIADIDRDMLFKIDEELSSNTHWF